MSSWTVDEDILLVHGPLRRRDIASMAKRRIAGIGVSVSLSDQGWSAIDEICRLKRCPVRIYPDDPLEIRDLDFVARLPSVTQLEVAGAIGNADGLERHPGLKSLVLATAASAIDLEFLSHHKQLEHLEIEGPFREQAKISCLHDLETLVLTGVREEGIGYLMGHGKLRSLRLQFLRIQDFAPVAGIPSLQFLGLHKLRRGGDLAPIGMAGKLSRMELRYMPSVSSLGWIARLRRLQGLLLDTLRNLSVLDGIVDNGSLRQLMFLNMKPRNDQVKRLATCKNLRELWLPPMWGKELITHLRQALPRCDFETWTPWR